MSYHVTNRTPNEPFRGPSRKPKRSNERRRSDEAVRPEALDSHRFEAASDGER